MIVHWRGFDFQVAFGFQNSEFVYIQATYPEPLSIFQVLLFFVIFLTFLYDVA